MDLTTQSDTRADLKSLIANSTVPSELKIKLTSLLDQANSAARSGQYIILEQAEKYIRLILSIPWNNATQDTLETSHAREIFDRNHYGMDSIKERIIEYLSVLQLQMMKNKQQTEKASLTKLRAPILCFVGLAGTGKTTLAYSIAEALGRSFVRIPFGGMGSAADLRGQSRIHPEAEPGYMIKALIRSTYKNPVILLDEVDRVSEAARADIMGVLVELLDPEQNYAYTDHYVDYPVDLSNVLFITTANNTKNIATAVLDRMEVIQMPSYTDDEKVIIGRDYIYPKARDACGLASEQLTITDDVWLAIVRPLGYDAGIRTLERTISGICRKAARVIVEKKSSAVQIDSRNIKEFLPQL